MMGILDDLRHGLRMAWKSPASTLVAVFSVALGIGANSAIFSLLDAAHLQPFPSVHEPGRLAVVYTGRDVGEYPGVASYQDYLDYQKQNEVFTELVASGAVYFGLRGPSQTERVEGAATTTNYFSMLGMRPAAGRFFLPEDEQGQNAGPVAVLGHSFWKRRFGGDPGVVGQTIVLNGQTATVIGVAAPDFFGLALDDRPEIWIPLRYRQLFAHEASDLLPSRRWRGLRLTGRLKPGVSLEQANANIALIAERLRREFPDENKNMYAAVVPAREATLSPDNRRIVLMIGGLLGIVSLLVLLLACLNVANVLLARALARQGEVFVRQALGGGRGRLIRQFFTENLIVGLIGGAFALLVAHWAARFLQVLLFPASFFVTLGLNGRVLAFTLALALVSVLLFGLIPALRASRTDLVRGIRGAVASVGGRHRLAVRKVLVVVQVAISLLLLIGFGLSMRTLRNMRSIDVGVSSDQVLVASVDIGALGYEGERVRGLYQQILERIQGTPGVASASMVGVVPVSGDEEVVPVSIDGYDPAPDENMTLGNNLVGPHFFSTVGMKLLHGRDFTYQDRVGSLPVAIVNETFAKRYWPGQDAIGKTIRIGGAGAPASQVIGVAEDGKYVSLREGSQPYVYLPHLQVFESGWGTFMTLLIRTERDPDQVVDDIRSSVRTVQPDLPLFDVRRLSDVLEQSMIPERALAMVLGFLALLAAGLAIIGLYGIMSYSVSQRTHEIGVRLAIGAQRGDVLRQMLLEGLVLTGIGLAIGFVAAWLTTQLISGLLYGVSSKDPVTFAGTALLLLLVALFSTYVPARRAMKVDPMITLRYG